MAYDMMATNGVLIPPPENFDYDECYQRICSNCNRLMLNPEPQQFQQALSAPSFLPTYDESESDITTDESRKRSHFEMAQPSEYRNVNCNGAEQRVALVDFERMNLENSETTETCQSKNPDPPEERRRNGAVGQRVTLRKCLLCPSFGLMTVETGELHRMYHHQRSQEEEKQLSQIRDQVAVIAYKCTECPQLVVPASEWEAHRLQHSLGFALARGEDYRTKY